jgi:hypothetical protein
VFQGVTPFDGQGGCVNQDKAVDIIDIDWDGGGE